MYVAIQHEYRATGKCHFITATMEYCYPIQLRELQHCIVPVKLEPFMIVIPVSSFLFKCVYMDSCDPDVKYVAIPPYVQIYDD